MSYLLETAGERERQPRDPDPIVTTIRRVDHSRCVAHVQAGGSMLDAIMLANDYDDVKPALDWAKDYPGIRDGRPLPPRPKIRYTPDGRGYFDEMMLAATLCAEVLLDRLGDENSRYAMAPIPSYRHGAGYAFHVNSFAFAELSLIFLSSAA